MKMQKFKNENLMTSHFGTLYGYSTPTGCAIAPVTVASEFPHSTLKFRHSGLVVSTVVLIRDLHSQSDESG